MARNKNHRNHGRRGQSVFRPFKRRAQVGALPGEIGPPIESNPTAIHLFAFDPEHLDERHHVELKSIIDKPDLPWSVQWIDVVGLGNTEVIEAVGKRFGIHPLLIEDIVHTHQRPKVEIQEGCIALILRIVEPHAPLRSEQLSFVLCGSTVITFQEIAGDCFEPVRRRIRNKLGSIRSLEADYTMYCLIDAVIDGFFPLLEDYGKQLEELEDVIDAGINPEAQQRIHTIRTELSRLRKIAWSHREAMQRLVTDAESYFRVPTLPFLRDCLDHTGQVLDVAETYREVASDMRDLYFAQISQRTNDVMKLLTIISTIFMPLTLIAGIYGMNFNSEVSPYNMPETQAYYGYPATLLLMLITAGVMLVYFYRKGWLFRTESRVG